MTLSDQTTRYDYFEEHLTNFAKVPISLISNVTQNQATTSLASTLATSDSNFQPSIHPFLDKNSKYPYKNIQVVAFDLQETNSDNNNNNITDYDYFSRQDQYIQVPDFVNSSCITPSIEAYYLENVTEGYRKNGVITDFPFSCDCYLDPPQDEISLLTSPNKFQTFAAIIYIILFVLGSIFNFLSLIIILNYKENKRYNTVDLVLACICFSDFILASQLPLTAAVTLENGFWPIKRGFVSCRTHGLLSYYSYFTGILYITLLSIYRYQIITSKTRYKITNSTDISSILVVFVFIPILTMFLLVPYVLFFKLEVPRHYQTWRIYCYLARNDMLSCTYHPNDPFWLLSYQFSKVIFGFLIPAVILSVMSLLKVG